MVPLHSIQMVVLLELWWVVFVIVSYATNHQTSLIVVVSLHMVDYSVSPVSPSPS